MRPRQRQLATLMLIAVIAYTGSGFACGSSTVLKSFRVALSSSGPLVNSLVASGAIPQTKSTAIIADFDASAQCGLQLENAFQLIPKDIPKNEQTSRKLNASVTALRCFKAIIDRQNFATHPRIQQVANIAEGVLASLVVFYSEPGDIQASVVSASPDAASAAAARNEEDLERQLKVRVEALKAAMKP